MRRLAFIATIALGACGLTVTGIAGLDEDITTPEGGTDAPAPDTSTIAETGPGTSGVDGSADASLEASAVDGSVDAETDASLDAAGTATKDASVDAGKIDAGDAGDAGAGCTVLLQETFGAPLVNWQAAGNPPGLDAVNKVYRLTTKGDDTVARAVWYTQPLTYTGVLRATVDFVVDPTGTSGTGISLVWGANADFRVGGAAMGLGICGNNIVAVGAQYRFSGRVDSVTSTNGSCGTNGGQSVQAGNAGTLQLTLDGTATVTGQVATIADNPSPATFTKTGYIGITASTENSGRSGIAIKSLRVVSCLP